MSALGASLTAHAAFDITVNFIGGLSPVEQAFFSAAETFWESVITGYAPGIALTGLTITASGVPLDGVGNVLGSAAFVPIELGGGSGTQDGHWNEVDGGGFDTGILDQQGRDKRFELMTGWLDTPAHVGITTVASFQDIGYFVNVNAVPEPAALALLLAGIPLVARRAAQGRRRRDTLAAPTNWRIEPPRIEPPEIQPLALRLSAL